MKYASITDRLAGLGGAKWRLHLRAKELVADGADIILMTLGEPDVPTPVVLMDTAVRAMRSGRTNYSDGRGEANLRNALAVKYTASTGRSIHADQILCFPGTQTALFAVMMGLTENGDEVLVGDPMYATYEGVIRANGAKMVPVPLHAEHGFRIQAEDIAAQVTPRTCAILLTTPHNPTGSILTIEDIDAIGELAVKHDLWIISDEVYEELVFEGSTHISPLSRPKIADRVIVVSSISKSHAAPGFRSGWCVGSSELTATLLPLSETMLFGNQPFIADMTELAVREGSTVALGMRSRYAARATLLHVRLAQECCLTVHRPLAGMFAMVNVSSTGMDGETYALDLLENGGVAVMPGASFGATMDDWVRIALTINDSDFEMAIDRIVKHSKTHQQETA